MSAVAKSTRSEAASRCEALPALPAAQNLHEVKTNADELVNSEGDNLKLCIMEKLDDIVRSLRQTAVKLTTDCSLPVGAIHHVRCFLNMMMFSIFLVNMFFNSGSTDDLLAFMTCSITSRHMTTTKNQSCSFASKQKIF